MDDKQRKQLMETLKNAIDVETETVTQDHMLQECIRIWEEKKPTLRLKEKSTPIYATAVPDSNSGKSTLFYVLFVCGVLCMIGFICLLIFEISHEFKIRNSMTKICPVFGLLFFLGSYKVRKNNIAKASEEKKKNEAYAEQIKSDNARIEKDNQSRRTAYYKDMQEWQKSYNEVTSKICSLKADTEKTLDRVYQTDLIYPKYRNLPALTCIYEYFVTGRCDELTGPHGAYNMYEDETRKDTIISQLNVVIDNLEQIKNSQYMLYQQVSAIRQDTYAVTRELQAIKGYTLVTAQMSALNAYYSAVTASNTRISAACDLLE